MFISSQGALSACRTRPAHSVQAVVDQFTAEAFCPGEMGIGSRLAGLIRKFIMDEIVARGCSNVHHCGLDEPMRSTVAPVIPSVSVVILGDRRADAPATGIHVLCRAARGSGATRSVGSRGRGAMTMGADVQPRHVSAFAPTCWKHRSPCRPL